MKYRVCIPTAGTGSRLGSLTKYINKSLVSVANLPVLSHIIDKYPQDVEFVVALGYKGQIVREYLELAYPSRVFFFVDVYPFEGPGAGLGLSILACEQYLQQPFIFNSCDTIVKEQIPSPDINWMAYSEGARFNQYRTLKVQKDLVEDICEKGVGATNAYKPYIGLASVFDFKTFWSAMHAERAIAIETGEVHGLRALLDKEITAYNFTWYDTGSPEALKNTREIFIEPDAPSILEKTNESIWFVDGRVIKFSDDKQFIANRVKRASSLDGFVPKVTDARPHMYSYSMVEGQVLSRVITLPLFQKLLEHSKELWKKISLDTVESKKFYNTCYCFYREKTSERVDLFYSKFDRIDSPSVINGIEMPALSHLLQSLDWEWLSNGIPGRFHGDFHFENILWDIRKKSFMYLDWRQDFGGDLVVGDIYYDFAKLLHGLIINHDLIAKNLYSIDWQTEEIKFDFHRKQILVECERYFGDWLKNEGYDRKKVMVLTALIYLNIAALHHHPYSLLLYSLGKSILFKELNNEHD